MKLIIEVTGGAVLGVYYTGRQPPKFPILLVDLDGAAAGEPVEAEPVTADAIGAACDLTKTAITLTKIEIE